MVEKYTAKQSEFGINQAKIRALHGNWLSDPFEPTSSDRDEFYNFDLVTVGAALHHFPDAQEAIRLLGARLKPGGVLYIQDRAEHQSDDAYVDESGSKGKMHGFDKDSLGEFMSQAGLIEFNWLVLPQDFKIELPSEEVTNISCFLARAMKPLA